MTVGDSIFLSALILGTVGLYAATKDRWNWKKLVKYVVGVPAVLIVLAGLGLWAYSEYNDRPTAQTAFGGVTIGSTLADVKLAKGNPSKVLEDGRWLYYSGKAENVETAGYVVRFKDGKVRYVLYGSATSHIGADWLQSFTRGTPYDVVLKKLGPPGHTSISEDGLERMISYPKFNTFYSFAQAQVVDFGVYDPATGPMEYTKKQTAEDAKPTDPTDPLGLFPNGRPTPASAPKKGQP
jgi:hypothetical protein